MVNEKLEIARLIRKEKEIERKELKGEQDKIIKLGEENKKQKEDNLKKRKELEENLSDNETSIKVMPFETFKLHDLANMFPFNITPALIESKIAHAIAAKQRMFNSLTPQMAFLIIALLVGVSIAGIILWKFMGAGTQEVKVTVDYASGMVQAVAANMTG